MLKRTLWIGQPAYLRLENRQLLAEAPADRSTGEIEPPRLQCPVEDIGLLVLEHRQITLSHSLIQALLDEQAAVLLCDARGLPSGWLLPLGRGHHRLAARNAAQLAASKPRQKQLWAHTVRAKLRNQAAVLARLGHPPEPLLRWAQQVRSGDPQNLEARAAAHYWARYMPGTNRDRYGPPPNPWLNYCYAILRALTARCLAASGLLMAQGMHHHNAYNPYALADDVMEPYRPLVDWHVHRLRQAYAEEGKELPESISKTDKQHLLGLPVLDTRLGHRLRPLDQALRFTCARLARCYTGQLRLPEYAEPAWTQPETDTEPDTQADAGSSPKRTPTG